MTSKLDKKIKKLIKSISKLTKKRKVKKSRKSKSRKTKKNIAAEFAQNQLLTQLRNAASSGGASSVVAHDAKRKVEEMQEEGRRSEKEKTKKTIEALEHKADENNRVLTGLQNFALQFQQEKAKHEHAPRGFAWHIEDDDEPESQAVVKEIKQLEHMQQKLDEKLQDGGDEKDVEELFAQQRALAEEILHKKNERIRKMVETKARKKAEKEEVARLAIEEAQRNKVMEEQMKQLALKAAHDSAEAARIKLELAQADAYERAKLDTIKQNISLLNQAEDDAQAGFAEPEAAVAKKEKKKKGRNQLDV